MPIINFGDKLKSVYLQRVTLKPGVVVRALILSFDKALAVQFHYLKFDNYTGSFQCNGDVCCKAFGVPQQKYYLPVWVYKNPQVSAEGEIQALQLTPRQYDEMVQLKDLYAKSGSNLAAFDFQITCVERGRGVDPTFSPIPGASLVTYLPAEVQKKIQESLSAFYELGEQTLVTPMDLQKWYKLIEDTHTALPRLFFWNILG